MESAQPVEAPKRAPSPMAVAHSAPEPTQQSVPAPKRRSIFARVVGRIRYEGGRIFARLDPLVSACFAGSRWAASMYYALWSGRFRREQRAFLIGKKRYQSQCESSTGNRWLLRRNVHRLEKGLCMRPLRKVFALEYLQETVQAYAALNEARSAATDQANAADSDLLHWAHDVLRLYFEKTVEGGAPLIEQQRRRFHGLTHGAFSSNETRGPYLRDLQTPPSVGMEDFLALAKRRRSVRWFENKPVPREIIDRAIEAAAYAPTACNRQAFEMHVFDAPEDVQKVAAVPMGTAGYCENIPTIAVLVGRMDAFFDERDRHLIYIDASLFAMGFLYALEAQGVSSCCINWPDIEEKERDMASLLNLEAWERPVMLIAFGYPDADGLVPYSQKKPLDELRRYHSNVSP